MASTKDKFTFLRKVLGAYSFVGILLIVFGSLLILVPSIPSIWYFLDGAASESEMSSLISQAQAAEELIDKYNDKPTTPDGEVPPGAEVNQNGVILPPLDTTLSEQDKLVISGIGVDAPLHKGKVGRTELEKGVWLTYGWGTPEDKKPIILAAHRFGYIYWSADFRKTQSFYNLPSLKTGDKVEMIWKQRKYEYEVVEQTTGSTFKHLNADLIMYTCKMFNSPQRIFVYAKRTN